MSDSDRPCCRERPVRCRRSIVVRGTCVLMLACLLGVLIEGLIPEAPPLANVPPLRVQRFRIFIPPNTPLKTLLPEAPDVTPSLSPWLVQDLTRVPEITFQKPRVIKVQGLATTQAATVIARINHVNQKGEDQFLKTLLANRTDLPGLPFIMGKACRQSKERAQEFRKEVSALRTTLQGEQLKRIRDEKATDARPFWTNYEETRIDLRERQQEIAPKGEDRTVARIAALMQMLAPEHPELGQGLVEFLSRIDHARATRDLARLAIFSLEEKVRQAALLALQDRPAEDSTQVLLAGLRYPWPAVASNASAAIVSLNRKDLLPRLVAVLDDPDPRAPAMREVDGHEMLAVRELVRLNHLHNCLLCHAPGNTPDIPFDGGRTPGVLTGPVPRPGQPLSSQTREYYDSESPDILVRADVTYLRQDFSLLHTVQDAAPWPARQRFDYLVRTRSVTALEAEAYRDWVEQQGPGYLPPNTQAILAALRALTGRDVAEPTATAWKLALGMSYLDGDNHAVGSDRLLLGLGGLVLFIALSFRRPPLLLHDKRV